MDDGSTDKTVSKLETFSVLLSSEFVETDTPITIVDDGSSDQKVSNLKTSRVY